MKIKKLLVAICVCALALTSVAFADDVMLISEAPAENAIYVNDAKIEGTYYRDADGFVMIPVRSVCEALGFNVSWDGATNIVTIEKMPLYFTFNVYEDGYTMAKTAPIKLGKAPYVTNGITYVPATFVQEILPCFASINEGTLYIASEDLSGKVTATVIFNEQVEGMCVLTDVVRGSVLANVSANTVIKDTDGNAVKLEDIAKGQLLSVVYDDFMTMSIPPITNALQITLLPDMAEVVEGTVCEVINDENACQIVIGDEKDPLTQTAFNISDETVLMALDGADAEISAFQKGTKISVVASMAATRSIPMQRAAYAVRIAE
jgi:hypothetical protein